MIHIKRGIVDIGIKSGFMWRDSSLLGQMAITPAQCADVSRATNIPPLMDVDALEVESLPVHGAVNLHTEELYQLATAGFSIGEKLELPLLRLVEHLNPRNLAR